ncbi:hypothetical protein [Frigidibacter mobilis]|uniref:Uncharacterized protein n=1 Tax=Frigidibacter mobilis TaxID=1335048 RepID=A0A159Z6L3_9RHOB|nr:hypothetical protein [Frigidibacter mobilis]AMY70140.1 hypothetical protein AKL17_2904 [Frigidibacter mobilis]
MTSDTFHPAPRYMIRASASRPDAANSADKAQPLRPAEAPKGAALILCIPLGALAWAGILAWVLT